MAEMDLPGTLIDCLRKRDININRDKLQTALEGEHSTAIKHWIREYLGPETLLTKEELNLYAVPTIRQIMWREMLTEI
jgi:hypothetical protein